MDTNSFLEHHDQVLKALAIQIGIPQRILKMEAERDHYFHTARMIGVSRDTAEQVLDEELAAASPDRALDKARRRIIALALD